MTYEDVLSFCEEQDVRFIRLSYFDIYGRQKNVSVLPTELKEHLRKVLVLMPVPLMAFR